MLKRLYQKIHKPARVLFYRDLIAHTGGHQKVADYFEHLQSSCNFYPEISFSARTRWDISNPWFPEYQHRSVAFSPALYDVIFLAGMDWQVYLPEVREPGQPVINLIQHVRHANPDTELYGFLEQRAIRICVSPQVACAINATGRVKGPVFTIPNGVDLPVLPNQKRYDIIILGIKQPDLAKQIEQHLAATGLSVLLVGQWVPRKSWYQLLAASRLAVLLPNTTEGFYLPALEALNYCDQVVVPDCIGNRDFCKHEQNCFMPMYDVDSILTSIGRSLALMNNNEALAECKRNAAKIVADYGIAKERKAFLAIMANVKKLWSL